VRVAVLATYIGISLDQSYKRLIAIAAAALLHDIGKVGYSIVNTYEGIKVTKEKMNLNLTHPVYGYKIAKNFLKLQDEICQAILNHHEQPDGKGFPRRVADIKLFITDKIVSTSNLFSHLIEKNAMNGLAAPINNLQYLLQNFPDKFDHRITQQLNKIRDIDSFQLLHDTPAPKEVVTDGD
ncbi:MAG: HD domain-containing protein, partial [Spirochaetota bacterium]|nr:HD domain-containing protein [Spirochaetota bacterium]